MFIFTNKYDEHETVSIKHISVCQVGALVTSINIFVLCFIEGEHDVYTYRRFEILTIVFDAIQTTAPGPCAVSDLANVLHMNK